MPGNYEVMVTGLPPGFYVKSIHRGDEDVLAGGLALAESSAPLEIVVSAAGARVDGVVVNAKNEPAAGASVVLAPVTPQPNRRDQYRSAAADQLGRFALQGIPPGDYRLFAVEDLETGAHQDPEFLKPFDNVAEKLRLAENARETRQIKLAVADERR
ncbi:MAG: carboxypeptidase-like regulatory domain-containing protein, partial [Bryobacteraceae bacterium]